MKLLYGATTRGGVSPAALRGYWADSAGRARTPVPRPGWASARGPPDRLSALWLAVASCCEVRCPAKQAGQFCFGKGPCWGGADRRSEGSQAKWKPVTLQ